VEQAAVTSLGRNLSTLGEISLALGMKRSRTLPSYSSLGVEETTLGGHPAIKLEYAYVVNGGVDKMPRIMRASDVLFLQGSSFFMATFYTEKDRYERMRDQRRIVLSSFRVSR